ncbi:iron-containing redox enzyme family protein [Cylindrospermum sp. FACHB-282]|uniref:iron-containing redox enzyme family protein n=1 Tax=Cylindrospermum sp. FACHB-282 TaxID=2692794 RepID=UPI001687DD4E|nr:iron-containing redox enzyme family protein [Cylindrospermum sp. FACHB-282]MBD2388684.1 iron-containing redox enzyme family protein [Cylindrospermum sp. FACHB-282]
MSIQEMNVTKLELLDVSHEIISIDEETANRLALQSKNINKISLDILVNQKARLNEAEKSQATPIAQKVIIYMMLKMQEINELLSERKEQGKITCKTYIRYLIQAWYCSSHTPELQGKFHQRIAEYTQYFNEDKLKRGSKFIRMMESEADEEIGHEILALRDLEALGVQQFNIINDVFDESKKLINTQSSLLNQSNFIGFLGYSSYMEFLFAKYIDYQLKLLSEQGIPREAQTFLYNHFVIDLSHAGHDIELLNFFVDSDEIVTVINENIDVVHSLYKGILARAFN